MSGDKRSVATDALETLGTIIDDTAGRDAIHLAVEPCIAGERLEPGEDIGLVDGKAWAAQPYLGIVDPFLTAPVERGQMFWLVVYPRQITSLRHVWTHPSFDDEVKETKPVITANSAEKKLRVMCDSNYNWPSYDALLTAVLSGDGYDDYLIISGEDAGGSIPSEVWDLLEVVTGKKLERKAYFSCSC